MLKVRKVYIMLLIIGCCLILIEVFALRYFKEPLQKEQPIIQQPPIKEIKIPESAIIHYPSEYNFAQSYNDCAPYNSAAVVRALTGENVSSAEFVKTITHRIEYNWTLPEGITGQLNEYNITLETPDLSGLSDDEKIEYLREQLSKNHPIILLIKKEDFQHYITLFGFDSEKDEFFIYDSLMERLEGGLTKDENGDLPGNKTITAVKLLDAWSGGELEGKYHWLAIVCSN